MRAFTDNGRELIAEFAFEREGDQLALVLESAGGKVKGSPHPRNKDYVETLRLLISRLARLRAVITSAVVDSRQVHRAGLSESERALITEPIQLTPTTDAEDVRKQLTSPQSRVGRSAGATGDSNNRKRIRIRLQVPGYGAHEAAELAAAVVSPRVGPDARDVLAALEVANGGAAIGGNDLMLKVDGTLVLIAPEDSAVAEPVLVAAVQAGIDRLWQRGSVSLSELGDDGELVGRVLAQLPDAALVGDPPTFVLGRATDEDRSKDKTYGVLDRATEVKYRVEQADLRARLVGAKKVAACALCGDEFPVRFLVAAHIKQRSVCDDDERRDLTNVAMLACSFGCDALFERGVVTVRADGGIRVSESGVGGSRFGDHLALLSGKRCGAHRAETERYFAWHRERWSGRS
ncbi:hypothetical protein [Actinokineospora iranica]|uniref:HNH endonuclease n=1 Tax=Actinokineospora iranica TaxID=1271860 RepID=A0A1G6LGX4_9PSEU|nr:hypothetical protein [Actinokineospora iranica]SDC42005.1 hypothetical protein SAMN05216174_10246 [Actinokineospora iranica]